MIWFLPAERRYIFVRGVDAWKRGRGGYLGARYAIVSQLWSRARRLVAPCALWQSSVSQCHKAWSTTKCVTLAGAFQTCVRQRHSNSMVFHNRLRRSLDLELGKSATSFSFSLRPPWPSGLPSGGAMSQYRYCSTPLIQTHTQRPHHTPHLTKERE